MSFVLQATPPILSLSGLASGEKNGDIGNGGKGSHKYILVKKNIFGT